VVLLDGIANALRVDVLVPSSDAEARELIAPQLAAAAANHGIAHPTGASLERLFQIGSSVPSETSHEAVFFTRDNRILATALRGGEVELELR